MNASSKLKSTLQVVLGGHVVAAGLATAYGNDPWYKNVIMPTVHFLFDAETSHKFAVWMAQHKLVPRVRVNDFDELVSILFLKFQKNKNYI